MPHYILTPPGEAPCPLPFFSEDILQHPLVRDCGYTFDLVTDPMPNPIQVVQGRMAKGREMVLLFLADNFASGVVLSAQQSTDMSNAFRPIRELLEAGALTAALTYIRAWPIDAVFTPERKARYRSMIEEYLANEAAS